MVRHGPGLRTFMAPGTGPGCTINFQPRALGAACLCATASKQNRIASGSTCDNSPISKPDRSDMIRPPALPAPRVVNDLRRRLRPGPFHACIELRIVKATQGSTASTMQPRGQLQLSPDLWPPARPECPCSIDGAAGGEIGLGRGGDVVRAAIPPICRTCNRVGQRHRARFQLWPALFRHRQTTSGATGSPGSDLGYIAASSTYRFGDFAQVRINPASSRVASNPAAEFLYARR